MALHRRISLSDLEASPEAPIASQPTRHLPPKYFEYKPGGRDEFFRDLEAYQAAAQIHAQHRQTAATSPTLGDDEDYEAPSYDSIGELLPTIHETKIFKKRLLDTLRAIRDFTEKRRKTPKWSNCFGLSNKVRLALAVVLILGMLGGIAAMAVTFRQVAGMLAMVVFLLVFLGYSFFIVRKFIYQERLVEALLIGLGKVERFEKIESVTLERIKKGIDATLSPYFWMESERRMEEAIPEELRVSPAQQRENVIQPPPPAHLPAEHLPAPVEHLPPPPPRTPSPPPPIEPSPQPTGSSPPPVGLSPPPPVEFSAPPVVESPPPPVEPSPPPPVESSSPPTIESSPPPVESLAPPIVESPPPPPPAEPVQEQPARRAE
ncbi:hypothetical protein TWF281_006295 [Arthrobotrys megalospora]